MNIHHAHHLTQALLSFILIKLFPIYHGQVMNELTVILKDDSRTYKQKFVIYEDYNVTQDDPLIQQCITDAKKNFDGEPENIQIKIHLEIQ
jgi:arabinogalactan endo-1,4-beta-galactosidase